MSKEKQILGDLVRLSNLLFELEDKKGRDELKEFIHAARNSWNCADEEIIAKLMEWE